MQPFDPPPPRDWMDERLEGYLDGDLTPEETARFERGLRRDDWAAELRRAASIRDGLRALPLPECPPHVTRAVLREARRRARAEWLHRAREALARAWRLTARPALAMAVLVALVVVAALVTRPPRDAPARTEVEHALAEVKWTLAYLSEVGRQTGASVHRDVLDAHVFGPMHEALGAFAHDPPE